MVVISPEERWSDFGSLLGSESSRLQFASSSLGSTRVCHVTAGGRSISFHYAEFKQDVTEEVVSCFKVDLSFKFDTDGICTFLLLIQGGHYSKRERRLMEALQAHFGAEALKFLTVLSLDDGEVAETMDDGLLELINTCDGRYCRMTSSTARDELDALLHMVDFMLVEHGATGYTEAMLTDAKRRSTEDSSMQMLRQKVREAEEKEREFKLLLEQREEKRAKELEELRAKHAEERQKEEAERKRHETKREGLEEAVVSHRATLQHQISLTTGTVPSLCC